MTVCWEKKQMRKASLERTTMEEEKLLKMGPLQILSFCNSPVQLDWLPYQNLF